MTLMVSVLMAPAVIYLTWRLSVALKWVYPNKVWKRFLPSIFLFSFYIFPVSALVYDFVSDGIDVLKFPKPLTYWFWVGLVFVYLFASWVIVADIIKLISRFLSDKKTLINGIYARATLFLFVVLFCFAGWKVYDNTTKIRIQHLELPIKDLPAHLDGFRIAHISDIQGDEYTGRQEIAHYVDKINEQHPDLILFTGDLISYGTDFIKMSAREFGKAKATYGAIAVVGDHDYWAGVDTVKKALNRQGIPLVQDANLTIDIDSTAQALITGVTEVYSKKADPQVVDSLTQNSDAPAFKIFASHQITDHLIEDARKNDYNLILAGHTHGGQVRVPFMGMTFSASDLETSYISGVYRKDGILINVNNGLGFTLAPIRYNAPPNISVIQLVAR